VGADKDLSGAPQFCGVDQRSIIYTGSMRIQVDDVDQAARDASRWPRQAASGGDQRRNDSSDTTAGWSCGYRGSSPR
jgi:hypothetical protein